MKRIYKRTRSRRPLRRRRRTRNSKALATRAYVRKLTARVQESKRTAINGVLDETDIDGWQSTYIGQNITVGVTDKGRIGNTINLTGIVVRWKIASYFVDDQAVIPTVHIAIVQPKNGYSPPHSRFYKTFDAGLDDPYEVLDKDSMNDGRRWLNTDDLKILKYYKKKIPKHEGFD